MTHCYSCLARGGRWQGNEGAGSKASYVLENTAYPVVTKTFHFLSPLSTPGGRQDRTGLLFIDKETNIQRGEVTCPPKGMF